jgi:Xaa-Pro aminopeptidase
MTEPVVAPDHIERVQRQMRDSRLDAVLAISRENLFYCIGTDFIMLDMGISSMLAEADAFPACVVPATGNPIRSWPALEGTIGLLVDIVRELGVERGRIGIEKRYMPVEIFEALSRALPHVTFEACETTLDAARMVKSPYEIDLLSKVARATSKAVLIAWERARPGDMERDVVADVVTHVMRFGSPPFLFNFGAGPNSALGHRWGDERRLETGDLIHADAKGRLRGYWADVSRNSVVGPPRQRQADLYARLVAIHDDLLSRLKPGVEAREIYEASRAAYRREGINVEPRLIGHGIGTAVHEAPLLEPDVMVPLEEGMVLTLEPTHYEDGARYHYENVVLVTPRGGLILSDYGNPGELYVIQ